jgi:hypothetical protein
MNAELNEFENRLRRRPVTEPSAGFRDRVLQRVTAELDHPAARPFHHLYWIAASAALIMIGFSTVGALQEGFSSKRHVGGMTMELAAVRQLENQLDGSLK